MENGSIDLDARRKAWTAYWQAGAMHSCPGTFNDAYQGAIGTLWLDLAAGLHKDDRVLDLGTGNGALPKLLWESAPDRSGLRIDAVDLAELRPTWFDPEHFPGIRFQSGVAMEQLPYAAESFDVVVSQYGIEYARRPDVFHEVLRVATPEARLLFVMHHADGLLARVAQEEAGHEAWLIEAGGVIDAAVAVAPWIAQARTGKAPTAGSEAEAARRRYNEAMTALKMRAGSAAVPDLLVQFADWAHRTLAGLRPELLQASIDAFEAARDGLCDAMLRSAEMPASALNRDGIEEIAAIFRTARPSARIEITEIGPDDGRLGWCLEVDARTGVAG